MPKTPGPDDETAAEADKVLRQEDLVRGLEDGVARGDAKRILNIMRHNKSQTDLNEALNRDEVDPGQKDG